MRINYLHIYPFNLFLKTYTHACIQDGYVLLSVASLRNGRTHIFNRYLSTSYCASILSAKLNFLESSLRCFLVCLCILVMISHAGILFSCAGHCMSCELNRITQCFFFFFFCL